MNLESLTQAVGPDGDLCRKPCPCGCHGWYGLGDNGPIHPGCQEGKCTGKVWDDQNPIVLALWEKCEHGPFTTPEGIRVAHESATLAFERDMDCKGTGYVPRPHEDAALGLLAATHKLGWLPGINSMDVEGGWLGTVYPDRLDDVQGEGPTAEDALAAAVEAGLRAAW